MPWSSADRQKERVRGGLSSEQGTMRLGHRVWSSLWSLGNTSAVPLLTQMKGVESRNSNQSPRRRLNGDGRMFGAFQRETGGH